MRLEIKYFLLSVPEQHQYLVFRSSYTELRHASFFYYIDMLYNKTTIFNTGEQFNF